MFAILCLQKKAPVVVHLADPAEHARVQALLSRGVYEQHTHLWGIAESTAYLESMFSPVTEGQHNRLQAAAQSANNALQKHFFSYQGKHAQGIAPEGLFTLVRWVREAVTPEETTVRITHALASCQDPQRPVNWNWAYTLRCIIRQAAYAQMDGSQDSYDQVPVETWATEDAWQEWLETNEPANVTVPWVLDIEPLEQLSLPQRVTALTNIECLITSCSCASDKARVALHMTSSTARYLYLRQVQRCQERNSVFRCEIDGKHELSFEIMQALEEMSRVQLRFLYGLNTEILSQGLSADSPLPRAGIRSGLQKPYVRGTDIRGPEAQFKPGECEQVIRELYEFLMELSHERGVEPRRTLPLVLRTHVGESNMFNNVHDPQLEQIGRENLSIIIRILEKMHAENAFQKDRVLFRLGHVTAITIGQAYRLRLLPHKVCMLELNYRSNLQTFASLDMGHLPVLKVLIADALYRCKRSQVPWQSRPEVNFLDLTCNTDGAGIMHSSMEEEFYLASNVLSHFKDNSVMEDGSPVYVPVYPEDLEYLDGCVNPEVTQELLQGRGLLCEDLRLEVRNLLRFDHFLGKSQPFPPSPRKRRRIGRGGTP
ncbi:hypothetical protein ABBQ38_010798 [Trebouxia sp. C0009 RCD-2024]